MPHVEVKPELLRWAQERSGRSNDELAHRFKNFPLWENGQKMPTLKQLEAFATATYTPIGYLFLAKPPEESLPIPDFRIFQNQDVSHPSPNLLETIYIMQRRQAWLHDRLIECQAEPLDFVGSAQITDDPLAIGREMRRIIGFSDGWAAKVRTWQEAVNELRRAIEQLGIMAVINGVVANNTHRRLDVDEFRGFVLCDDYAPLIFVNGADSKSAQMFTLAHELAHIWLGHEGVSGFKGLFPAGADVETFCDKAAAEFLVPAQELKAYWKNVKHEAKPFEAIAANFKVSPIVAGRRVMDLNLVDRKAFFDFYNAYIKEERKRRKRADGGDFSNTQNTRIGKTFARQVIYAAKEGRITFKEAYELTGLKGGAFQEYGRRLGFDLS
jgi:Zn-dependent peptidase ImmA (M78 family)